MFGTTQDTEEENLIILWDDSESSEAQITPSIASTPSFVNTSEFTLDLWETEQQKVEAPSVASNDTFSIEWLDLWISSEEKTASSVHENKTEEAKTETQDFSLDFSNSGTSEVTPVVNTPTSTESFSLGEPVTSSQESLDNADDMVSILSGTIAKLKGRQAVIESVKLTKTSEVSTLNEEINHLKEEVSILKDEISSLDSENDQIEKNVQALDAMKGIPTTSAKVHNIKRAPNTNKV